MENFKVGIYNKKLTGINSIRIISLFVFMFSLVLLFSCHKQIRINQSKDNWKSQLESQMPLLGHRNWILIVDKAFPLQNYEGIQTINTNEKLLTVFKYALQQINSSTHVKPIIYTDKELKYLSSNQIQGIEIFRQTLFHEIGNNEVNVIKHDSVFVKIDNAAKLFKVLVLKTNETIPYSSVFIQLDCKYWDSNREKQLRDCMK